jgi:hypothetical protein
MSLQGAHQINNIIQHMFTQDNFLFYRGNLDTLKFNMFIKLSIRWETAYLFYVGILIYFTQNYVTLHWLYT